MIEIIHNPYGQGHPYEQLPEERFPREPLAGQPFGVGITIRPPGAAGAVTVHTRVDGQPGPSVPADFLADWQAKAEDGYMAEFLERIIRIEQDVWRAELTAPQSGQTLEYWIEAGGQVSETFTLRPAAWQAADAPAFRARASEEGVVWQVGPGASAEGSGHQPDWLPGLLSLEWLTDGTQARRVRLVFQSPADEAFYGLGERFNALNQRGNTLDICVYDQFRYQGKRTYMPVPFLLSSRSYGLWVDSSRWMQFDLAEGASDRWVLEAELGPERALTLHWLTGDSPFAIISRFTTLTGKPKLPPLWSFGLWMSANEWNSQAKVVAEVEQTFAHRITPSVLVIEAWSDEMTFYTWNDAQSTPRPGGEHPRYGDFTFPAEGRWPDPQGLVDWLHGQDIRLILWQIPALKAPDPSLPNPQADIDRAYFIDQGFGVREPDGRPYQIRSFWFREGLLWDVTSPAANDWWLNKRAYLLEEMGIDGFKTDGGEHIWGRDTRFADGRAGADVWNEYPRRYTEAYYRFSNEKRGGDALTFSRAGFTGSQASPVHWAGDQPSTWNAFRTAILAGLSAGISGIPFWGLDIGGFSGPIPSAELYLRGAAMAAFCPLMQYHSDYNQYREPAIFRTPWNIQAQTGDERVIPIFRHFTNVRHNLMPYIWQEAQHTAASGEPLMRALALTDPAADPYQYCFGRDLLVTPVTEPEASTWAVYLPEGTWFDLWTGEALEGGGRVEMPVPLERIPVFVRAGAAIPARLGAGGRLGDPVPLSAEPDTLLRF